MVYIPRIPIKNGEFPPWTPPVPGAFLRRVAIRILRRGLGQVQLHPLAAQQQLPQTHAIHGVAAAGFGDHEAEEFETLDATRRGEWLGVYIYKYIYIYIYIYSR